ncbi:unnamed protein product, partial [Brenthis ino]
MSTSASREDAVQDFIEHVLRIPNPEKVLNSVLGRLEKSRQGQRARPRFADDTDCDQPEILPEYTESLENSHEREMRQLGSQICSSLGFSCVQWNKTIHLTRRRYSSDCWETKTMIIPAGCECMWPVHRLGDMTLHV